MQRNPLPTKLSVPPSLDRLASDGPIALFLDFDGTLVDIAAEPDAIAVPSRLIDRLRDLDRRLDGRLALISGRSIADLERHLGPIDIACAGSHGSDCRDAAGKSIGEPARSIPDAAIAAIAEFAARDGIAMEEKTHGRALHYRDRPEDEESLVAFAAQLAAEHDLTVKRGKCVVELVANGADKGTAVETFLASAAFNGAKPFFVGDDVTDEDGFAACAAHGGHGIAVGDRPSRNARYHLASPAEVLNWLNI